MPEFHFPISGATRLASLAGINADLDQVLEYCDRMIDRYAGAHLKKSPFDIVGFTTHVDFVDWEALSVAACIAYARCFVSGVRQRLDATILEADAELRMTHELVMHLRNKHIAHSVNSFEENSVTVHVEDFFKSSAEVGSVVPRHTRQTGLSFDMPEKLKQLAKWWKAKVRKETSEEMQQVLQLAQAMPLDQIRAFGSLKLASPDERLSRIAKKRSES